MKKFIVSLIGLSALFCLAACSQKETKTTQTVTGDYIAHLMGEDWGSGIDSITIHLNGKIDPDSVTNDTLAINETKEAFDWQKPEAGLTEVTNKRKVKNIYVSDQNGKKTADPSDYLTVEMEISPEEGSYFLLSPDSPSSQYPNKYDLDISLNKNATLKVDGNKVKELSVDSKAKKVATSADQFKIDQYQASDGIDYSYAYYEPKEKSDTLVVWLHGILEGGLENTDPYVTTLGNKVPVLMDKEFQETIGGANILVPQSPTFWMDNTGEGKMENGRILTDGTSYYLNSLHELIDTYKEKVGAKKVVIAGCSNGGYMGMLMASEYGQEYDAYMLICEAMEDRFISDEQINRLKDLPIYFVYSNDDNIVDPTQNEIPTIARLKQAGADKIQVASFDHVLDTTGRFKDQEGNPYNYGGHSSWIYFFNNEVTSSDGVNSWQWIADQIKD